MRSLSEVPRAHVRGSIAIASLPCVTTHASLLLFLGGSGMLVGQTDVLQAIELAFSFRLRYEGRPGNSASDRLPARMAEAKQMCQSKYFNPTRRSLDGNV